MKKTEDYREEMDKVIKEHDFDLSNEEVVKHSLELENAMYDKLKGESKKD